MSSSHKPSACVGMDGLPIEALRQVAAYFQVLAEPTRLQILNLLRQQPRNVGELAQLTGYSAANVSRHLTLLTRHNFIARESRGNAAYFRIADASIYGLCDLVCDNIARGLERSAPERAAFVVAPAAAPARAARQRAR